ncbi:Rieske (2Fe-2S) protein [Roseivirga pacifica]|uniref:Rieske (2Fe-2S) protein n=1 Tax=Roseivirga pacifica TaxID=1267423 RepID=UPI003BA8684C
MPNVKVFQSEEQLKAAFTEKSIRIVRIGEKKVCLAKHGQAFFAFQQLCPHQMHPLKEANITAFGEVVCPLHEYRFNLKTGQEANNRCQAMQTHQLQITTDGVYLNL